MSQSLRVRFQGQDLLLLGATLADGGPLTTEENYVNGVISVAHLTPDGRIMQYRRQIGTRADIEVLELVPTPILTLEAAGEAAGALLRWFTARYGGSS